MTRRPSRSGRPADGSSSRGDERVDAPPSRGRVIASAAGVGLIGAAMQWIISAPLVASSLHGAGSGVLPIPLAIGVILTAGVLFATVLIAGSALRRGGVEDAVARRVLWPIGVVSIAVVVALVVVSYLV
ncbi:hypothetical protein GCM10027515_22360 [Schumannella luteola]|uniref:Uncharacterized protein n=1 Tax=Schumannella luteola TaxID=472059 RepID=A0A852YL91_9MICO|nr:hypothetical protein [Schumannella luteola]NYG99968.1 hypothetical protein [Schumannella luteola]TPX05488.1 hypothetical protein FJ656_06255 [Schumannella luteola]